MKLTERQKTIDLYLRCSANLFGHITPRAFLILFNKYNQPKLLKAELLSYRDKLNRQSGINYVLYDNAIVNSKVSNKVIDLIIYYQQDKSFYMPNEVEFLKYQSSNYYENSEYVVKIRTYLQKELQVNMFTVTAFLEKLTWLIRIEASNQEQMDLFEHFNIKFESISQLNDFYGLVANLSNNTRKWANCGFTPEELFRK